VDTTYVIVVQALCRFMDGLEASNTIIIEGQGPWILGQEWLITIAMATIKNLLEMDVLYKEV
jgi:hypothetical protein